MHFGFDIDFNVTKILLVEKDPTSLEIKDFPKLEREYSYETN